MWLFKKIMNWVNGIFILDYNVEINESKIFINNEEVTDPEEKERIRKDIKPSVDAAMNAAGHAMDAARHAVDIAGTVIDKATKRRKR